MRTQSRVPGITATGAPVGAARPGFTISAKPARVAPPTSAPSAFTTTAPLIAGSAWSRPATISATWSRLALSRTGFPERVWAEMRKDRIHASTRAAVVRAVTEWVVRI